MLISLIDNVVYRGLEVQPVRHGPETPQPSKMGHMNMNMNTVQ